jgi:hypothetical protein
MISKTRQLLFLSLIAVFLTTALSACSPQNKTDDLNMLPAEQMPAEVQSVPVMVRQAYQFAAANPDLMKQIPCYCGCSDIGHSSNYDCYVSHVDDKGVITFDNHAIGCSICVDITQDVMRMMRQGKRTQEIRTYIDATYSKYGPSNIP